MDERTRSAFAATMKQCVESTSGELMIESAKSKLLSDLEANKFNSVRAEEIFRMSIEKAIYHDLGSAGVVTVRVMRHEGLIEVLALEYVREFKKISGASDQRSERQGIMAKIFGR